MMMMMNIVALIRQMNPTLHPVIISQKQMVTIPVNIVFFVMNQQGTVMMTVEFYYLSSIESKENYLPIFSTKEKYCALIQ
jgi:hypothetical protein